MNKNYFTAYLDIGAVVEHSGSGLGLYVKQMQLKAKFTGLYMIFLTTQLGQFFTQHMN